jgi:hypothetical protein
MQTQEQTQAQAQPSARPYYRIASAVFSLPWARLILMAAYGYGMAGAESPKLYLSLNSLYGMAADRHHVRDFGAAWEAPVGGGFTAVARSRYLRVEQRESGEVERKDNVYANTFPSTYRIWGFQGALRRHPLEWMPGFFSEALLGYKYIHGANPEATPGWSMDGFTIGPGVGAYSNHAFEAALGFGYLWEVKRMRFALGFAFGPEFLYRESALADGSRQSSGEILDLLRFNQFEAGFAF